jgi:hypothetical protein
MRELSGIPAISAELEHEPALRVELEDAVVARVGDEDVPLEVGRHAGGFAIAGTGRRRQERPLEPRFERDAGRLGNR